MPPNARGIKNHLRAKQRRNPRTFRIPLVPANLYANPRILRIEIQKSQVSRRKIKFLVVQRIIRNVHLPVFPQIRPIRVQHRARVVINPRRPPFKHGRHQRRLLFLRHRRQSFRRRSRHRFRQVEQFRILCPAKIFPRKQFVHADNLRPLRRRFANLLRRPRQILFFIPRAPHLHEPHRKFIRHHSLFSVSSLFLLCELRVPARFRRTKL